jgi:hypothetical protein
MDAINDDLAAQTAALKKEAEERKKDAAALKKQVQEESRKARELSMLPLLLQRQPQIKLDTTTLTTPSPEAGKPPVETTVVTNVQLVQPSDNLTPILLAMGDGMGSDNSMLVLALALSQKPQQ